MKNSLSFVAGLVLAISIQVTTTRAYAEIRAAPPSSCSQYENAERTSFQEVCDTSWSVGLKPPARKTQSQKDDVMLYEVVGERLLDCSNKEYRCVASWGRTYAVPRKRLSPDARYSLEGVSFRIEKCIRGDASVCQVALISGGCVENLDHECVPEPIAATTSWGYVVYFIYNEDFGVTAMGVAPKPVADIPAMQAIASQSILQGRNGILF